MSNKPDISPEEGPQVEPSSYATITEGQAEGGGGHDNSAQEHEPAVDEGQPYGRAEEEEGTPAEGGNIEMQEYPVNEEYRKE